MVRKVAFLAVRSLVGGLPAACWLLILSVFFLILHALAQPFDNRAMHLMDRVEQWSLISIVCTLLGKFTLISYELQSGDPYYNLTLVLVFLVHMKFWSLVVWTVVRKALRPYLTRKANRILDACGRIGPFSWVAEQVEMRCKETPLRYGVGGTNITTLDVRELEPEEPGARVIRRLRSAAPLKGPPVCTANA